MVGEGRGSIREVEGRGGEKGGEGRGGEGRREGREEWGQMRERSKPNFLGEGGKGVWVGRNVREVEPTFDLPFFSVYSFGQLSSEEASHEYSRRPNVKSSNACFVIR